MPGVINDFKVKQLKTQFETADSIITQAMQHTVRELGYEKPTDLNLPLNYPSSSQLKEYDFYLNEINEIWIKQFKGAKPLKWTYGDTVKTKDHTILGNKMYGSFWGNGYLLPNGMFITSISWRAANPTFIKFQFDTNGPFKGPNRYGHDLFIYFSAPPSWWECNPVSGTSEREKDCYWFAHNKVNPNPKVDKSKEYWDILFKPRSYWE